MYKQPSIPIILQIAMLQIEGAILGNTNIFSHTYQESKMAASQDLPKHSYKGREYTFVDPAVHLLEEFKCAICLQLVNQPVLTSCGHFFCVKCIKSQQTCPTCRKRFTTTRDQRSERLLKAFKVKCPISEKGCAWEGDLEDTEEHMNKNCPHQQVSCPNGCRKTIERKSLPAHSRDSCTHRKYKCPYCWEEGLYKEITKEHLVTCRSLLLDCPAECGRHVERRRMKRHLSMLCPEEYVSCKYAVNGCDVLVKRKDREKHETDDSLHLQMVIKSQAQLLQLVTKCLITKSWDSADATSLPLSSRPWLQNTPTCYPVPPCVVKFEQISLMTLMWPKTYSVYSHFGGHEFELSIGTYKELGLKSGMNGTHLKMDLQKDPENPHLSFPFKGEIQVTLLNQMEDRNHHPLELERASLNHPATSFKDKHKSKEYDFTARLDEIITLDKTCPFVQNDCVFFRVDKITF